MLRHFSMPIFAVLMLCLLAGATVAEAAARPVTIQDVRLWRAPDNTRLVFDLDKGSSHSLQVQEYPPRVIIDVPEGRFAPDPRQLNFSGTPVASLQALAQANGNLRIVLELSGKVRAKSFFLDKNPPMGDRLVLDLFDAPELEEPDDIAALLAEKESPARRPQVSGAAAVTSTAVAARPATTAVAAPAANTQPLARPMTLPAPQPGGRRDLVIAIDAGHGGEDPGAIGPNGIREKDVVMAISRRLHDLFSKEPGYKPVLVRKSDYYVGLTQRSDIARKANADLFISIHADAFTRPQANGSSVYALSSKGASSASAQFLADKENKSDLVGGVSLDDKDAVLSSVLVDLSMTYKMESSLDVGATVLRKMANISRLHSNRVEQAAFVVLKTPDIPSILVETGFISNHAEARKLNSADYQQKMATAIFQGVHHYFLRKAPEGTLIAAKGGGQALESFHIVARGETLSEIARRYSVSMNTLVSYNNLRSTDVRIGQELKIPARR